VRLCGQRKQSLWTSAPISTFYRCFFTWWRVSDKFETGVFFSCLIGFWLILPAGRVYCKNSSVTVREVDQTQLAAQVSASALCFANGHDVIWLKHRCIWFSPRCGALHIGDQILSIDNVSMSNGTVNVREASEMLQSASDEIKLEILPVSHLAIASPGSAGRKCVAVFQVTAGCSKHGSNFSSCVREKKTNFKAAGATGVGWQRRSQKKFPPCPFYKIETTAL